MHLNRDDFYVVIRNKVTSVKSTVDNLVEEDDVRVCIVEHAVLGLGQRHWAKVLNPPNEEAGAVRLDDVTKVLVASS